MLNLKENELDLLAKFMGNDIRIHREFYCLPSDDFYPWPHISMLMILFYVIKNMYNEHIKSRSADACDEQAAVKW